MKSILDPTFRYTPSVETDLRKTFKRLRRQQKQRELEQQQKLVPMLKRELKR